MTKSEHSEALVEMDETRASAAVHWEPAWTTRGTWVRWVQASVVGMTVGEFANGIFSETMGHGGLLGPEGGFGDGVAHAGGLFIGGALMGILQWLMLREHVEGAGWVVLGNGVGLALGFLLGFILGGGFPFDFLGGYLLLGLVGGITQWLVLRRHVVRAALLVPANTLGFTLGGMIGIAAVLPVGDAIDAALGDVVGFATIVSIIGAVTGIVGGVITGAVLARLLRRP
jgi:hypothetical protein